MFWIIDLIIIAIIAICLILGYKRGLTGCILKILSFIIALVIAFILFKPVSNYIINNTLLDNKIEEAIIGLVGENINESGVIEEGNTNLPKSIMNYINESIENAVGETKQEAIEQVAKDISVMLINMLAGICVFIIARVILIFIKAIANIITDLPIIKQVDKLGGIIYGVLEGLIIVFIILAIISFISPLIEDTGLLININKSVIGSFMYNNNILLNIIF